MTIQTTADAACDDGISDSRPLFINSVRLEWCAGIIVVIGLVSLRVYFALHAGGLWRDEVHSAVVAQNPAMPMWQDSFPILWIGFLRIWCFACGNFEDGCLRSAGLFCGVLMLFSAIWAAQGRSRAVPWTTLLLFGMSPVVVTYGTEVRGYALGVATQLWMLGSLQRYLLEPSSRRLLLLGIASVVAVQAAFTNSFLLLAGSISSGIICLCQKRWRVLACLIANGLISFVTVCPYLLILLPAAAADWGVIVRHDHDATLYMQKMVGAFGSGGWLAGSGWCLVCCLACYGGFKELARLIKPKVWGDRLSESSKGGFEVLLLVFGSALVLVYLKLLKVPSQDWYYMPLLGLYAFCFDSIVATWRPQTIICIAKLVLSMVVGMMQFSLTWNAANIRMTNVDVASRTIARAATSQDLVVLIPWYFAITTERYYHGDATWITVPKIKETETSGVLVHSDGYRAVKAAMMLDNPIAEELSLIQKTLLSGGKIYLVGNFRFLQRGEPLLNLSPAPDSKHGWSEGAYESDWMQQIGLLVQKAAFEILPLPVDVGQAVNRFENCQVYVIALRNRNRVDRDN